MANCSMKCLLTCVTALALMCASPTPSSASLIIDSYFQEVYQAGWYNPTGVSKADSQSLGPLSASSASGYAQITNSAITSSSIEMSYSLGVGPISGYGSAYAYQGVSFHVDADTPFFLSLSPYGGFISSRNSNNISIYNQTTSQFEFDEWNSNGAGIFGTGMLYAGNQYYYSAFANPEIQTAAGESNQFAITGQAIFSTTPVPEPSSLALAGLGGLGLAFTGYRRRRAVLTA